MTRQNPLTGEQKTASLKVLGRRLVPNPLVKSGDPSPTRQTAVMVFNTTIANIDNVNYIKARSLETLEEVHRGDKNSTEPTKKSSR